MNSIFCSLLSRQGCRYPLFKKESACDCRQMVELEAAKRVLAQRLDMLSAELADKDARLAHITTQLHHAREQLAAKQRWTPSCCTIRVHSPRQCSHLRAAMLILS